MASLQLIRKITQYSKLLICIEEELKVSIGPALIAIVGPPAVGKSTLAKQLVNDLKLNGYLVQFCPMDGFHMTNKQLDEAGLRDAKGRIDTFQANAFSNAVKRLKSKKSFWWPIFSRTKDNPISEGSFINGKEDIYILEGNYLLENSEPWVSTAKNFQLSIFVDLPDKTLRERLHIRHKKGGYSFNTINDKIDNIDMLNASMIRETQSNSDIIFSEPSNY